MTSKQKKLGSALEHRVVERARSKQLEARVQPGSGIYHDHPSDCVVAHTLVECKVRSVEIDAKGNRTFRVDLDWWDRVKAAAHKASFDLAALVMNAKGSQKPMVLIDLDHYLDLLAQSQAQAQAQDQVKVSQPDG